MQRPGIDELVRRPTSPRSTFVNQAADAGTAMEDRTEDVFVNRQEPIPVVRIGFNDAEENVAPDDPKPKRLRDFIPGRRLRSASQASNESTMSVQDRLLEKLLERVIPADEGLPETTPSPNFVERPNFNITTMSNNFRRFNARVGVLFVFQARMTRLMSWKRTSHTLSLLAVYSFVCLDPYLLTVLPLAAVLLGVLIPAFIARHPAPPPTTATASDRARPYSTAGPPIAPAMTVKPAKELSKDFFRNMRDLQNSMEDFSRVHDQIVAAVTPRTNFSDEARSSALFIALFAAAAVMCIAAHLLPWRLLFLAGGWAVVGMGHPTVQRQMAAAHEEHVAGREAVAKSRMDRWITRDIVLDSPPEVREVEVFELQRLPDAGGAEWEAWLFAPSPYDPMSGPRIHGERPRGTRFFEDVLPPDGWEWSEKKWALDLQSRVWVEERIITGVEIETEGERWVYDLEQAAPQAGVVDSAASSSKRSKAKAKVPPSWEESGIDNSACRGEWRRRRWTRLVKRRNLSREEAA